jgi:hypothetical protein
MGYVGGSGRLVGLRVLLVRGGVCFAGQFTDVMPLAREEED